MLDSLFDQTINTLRLQDEDGNQISYATFLTGVACAIQQMDAETTRDATGDYGKNWLMFCPLNDIVEGDQVDWDGKIYRVQAVDRLEFLEDGHMEVQLRIFES